MKRRTVLAGLLIVALAALLVALVRSGSGGEGAAEITEGKPFNGNSPVTRSVAWIAAQQRHLDQHPEIERRLEREAATAEAAREEAAGEQAAGEEGEATTGEAGEGSEEQGEPAGEEEAAGGAEAEGEHLVLKAAAGDAPVETDIREKPEPGEETGPSRRAATPAPQARIGRSAIGPRSSLSEGTSFLGADSNVSGFIPPDSMGAVGPTQVLVFVNGRMKLYDKQGTPDPNLDVTDLAFWAPVRDNRQVTDPGVEYDRLSQRWIISGINVQSTDNRVMIAVSDGPTLTNQSSFDYFSFDQSDPLPPGPARFADYPQLAVDNNAIYVGVNEFTSSSGSFAGTSVYVIRKSSVISGMMNPIFVTGFRTLANAVGQGPDSPQPATTANPNVAEGYVVGPDNQIANRIDVRRITDPGGTPGISPNLVVPIPVTAQPLPVPAQGTTGGLDALDDRLFEAMIARGPDGTDSLWTAHNIRVNASGIGSANGDRDAARWYQLGDLGPPDPPTLVQSGTLFDTAASNPRYFWMPSIAMNGQGHASLNTSTAGNGRRAEVAGSGRLASDPLNTTQAFDVIQSSNNGYNLGASAPRRWGDFSQTVVDPTDDQTFWTFQEYTSAQNVWGVRVIQLKAPPPAVPADASPNSVLIDTDPQPVAITGIPTAGAGFFDTTDFGPPYPDYEHLSATVGNGVVVNSVTLTDPTHLTLDLDTSGATPGFAPITITNPDGQSTTCSHALIVGSDATPAATPSPQATSPPSPANNNSPTVFGSGADCGSDVSIYADDPTCTDPPLVTDSATAFASPGIPVSVADNTSTDFYAKATSVANVPSACSTTAATYVEDSIPPQVSVNSGPTGTTADQTPTFTFSGSDAVGPVTFRCSLDTGTASFSACSGPGNSDTPSSPLADGFYTFRVRASDAAGNSSVATRSFSVLVPQPQPTPTAPETTINKGPKKTRKARPKFRFSSNDPSASFQCKLDKRQFVACASPFTTPKLRPGKHKLQVRAIGAGGVDPSPAVRKFRVLPPK
ncbi:MAG TPA: Ig-like domain-containing protein [Solirubrobacterales bacterium]